MLLHLQIRCQINFDQIYIYIDLAVCVSYVKRWKLFLIYLIFFAFQVDRLDYDWIIVGVYSIQFKQTWQLR